MVDKQNKRQQKVAVAAPSNQQAPRQPIHTVQPTELDEDHQINQKIPTKNENQQQSGVQQSKGIQIGSYKVVKTLGQGTFGKVKEGIHIHTNQKVAIKILEKNKITDVNDVERVAREIHILKIVRHPHIIQLYEIIETPRRLFLIMEHCCNGELFSYITSKNKLKEEEACRLFQQLIQALTYLGRLGIAHRDVKPENLLLDEQLNLKMVDFGLSNTYKVGEKLATACGSPCYAAPELIKGLEYNGQKADLWSAGVVLFTMVCGHLPFEDSNTQSLYQKILNARYKFSCYLSPEVTSLIQNVLVPDPELRYGLRQVTTNSWFKNTYLAGHCKIVELGEEGIEVGIDDIQIFKNVLTEMAECSQLQIDVSYVKKLLQANMHGPLTAFYHLLLKRKIIQGETLEDINGVIVPAGSSLLVPKERQTKKFQSIEPVRSSLYTEKNKFQLRKIAEGLNAVNLSRVNPSQIQSPPDTTTDLNALFGVNSPQAQNPQMLLVNTNHEESQNLLQTGLFDANGLISPSIVAQDNRDKIQRQLQGAKNQKLVNKNLYQIGSSDKATKISSHAASSHLGSQIKNPQSSKMGSNQAGGGIHLNELNILAAKQGGSGRNQRKFLNKTLDPVKMSDESQRLRHALTGFDLVSPTNPAAAAVQGLSQSNNRQTAQQAKGTERLPQNMSNDYNSGLVYQAQTTSRDDRKQAKFKKNFGAAGAADRGYGKQKYGKHGSLAPASTNTNAGLGLGLQLNEQFMGKLSSHGKNSTGGQGAQNNSNQKSLGGHQQNQQPHSLLEREIRQIMNQSQQSSSIGGEQISFVKATGKQIQRGLANQRMSAMSNYQTQSLNMSALNMSESERQSQKFVNKRTTTGHGGQGGGNHTTMTAGLSQNRGSQIIQQQSQTRAKSKSGARQMVNKTIRSGGAGISGEDSFLSASKRITTQVRGLEGNFTTVKQGVNSKIQPSNSKKRVGTTAGARKASLGVISPSMQQSMVDKQLVFSGSQLTTALQQQVTQHISTKEEGFLGDFQIVQMENGGGSAGQQTKKQQMNNHHRRKESIDQNNFVNVNPHPQHNNLHQQQMMVGSLQAATGESLDVSNFASEQLDPKAKTDKLQILFKELNGKQMAVIRQPNQGGGAQQNRLQVQKQATYPMTQITSPQNQTATLQVKQNLAGKFYSGNGGGNALTSLQSPGQNLQQYKQIQSSAFEHKGKPPSSNQILTGREGGHQKRDGAKTSMNYQGGASNQNNKNTLQALLSQQTPTATQLNNAAQSIRKSKKSIDKASSRGLQHQESLGRVLLNNNKNTTTMTSTTNANTQNSTTLNSTSTKRKTPTIKTKHISTSNNQNGHLLNTHTKNGSSLGVVGSMPANSAFPIHAATNALNSGLSTLTNQQLSAKQSTMMPLSIRGNFTSNFPQTSTYGQENQRKVSTQNGGRNLHARALSSMGAAPTSSNHGNNNNSNEPTIANLMSMQGSVIRRGSSALGNPQQFQPKNSQNSTPLGLATSLVSPTGGHQVVQQPHHSLVQRIHQQQIQMNQSTIQSVLNGGGTGSAITNNSIKNQNQGQTRTNPNNQATGAAAHQNSRNTAKKRFQSSDFGGGPIQQQQRAMTSIGMQQKFVQISTPSAARSGSTTQQHPMTQKNATANVNNTATSTAAAGNSSGTKRHSTKRASQMTPNNQHLGAGKASIQIGQDQSGGASINAFDLQYQLEALNHSQLGGYQNQTAKNPLELKHQLRAAKRASATSGQINKKALQNLNQTALL